MRRKKKRRWLILLIVALFAISLRKWLRREQIQYIAPPQQREELEEFIEALNEEEVKDIKRLKERLREKFLHLLIDVRRKHFPKKVIIIEASERVPCAKIYKEDRLYLVDTEGVVYNGISKEELPFFEGELSSEIIQILCKMKEIGLSPHINLVRKKDGDILLYTKEPSIEIRVGRYRKEKLLQALKILEFLQKKKYTCRYIDMRFEEVYVGDLKENT